MDVVEEVQKIEDIVNTAGLKELEDIGRKLANIHPTLQQNFMRVVVGFIKAEAEKRYYDDRNKNTVELCKRMVEIVENCYLPFI